MRITESIVGAVDWRNESEGFCVCPGESLHTTRNGKKDCKISLNGAPTLHCFHAHCSAILEQFNRRLRSTIGKAEIGQSVNIPQRPVQIIERQQKRRELETRAKDQLPRILSEHGLTREQFTAISPVQIPGDARKHWRLMLELFDGDDLLWLAPTPFEAKENVWFRTCLEWYELDAPSNVNFTSAAIFKTRDGRRCKENVLRRPYLVIESDTLGDNVLAIFRWLQIHHKLRAIVFTGGKSLHGWFDYPHPAQIEQLKIILPAMGCDPKLFTPSQPCRMPGTKRQDKPDKPFQTLIYLDKDL